MGVVRDRKSGTWAAVLSVHGRSFSLLEPSEKERRLGAWGAFLAGLARDGSPIHRIQWVERSVPGDGDALARHFSADAAKPWGKCHDSYAELIAGAGPASQDHEILLVIAVHARRSARALRGFGRGDAGAFGLLRREVSLLRGQLQAADVTVERVLDEHEMVVALREGFDARNRSCSGIGWPARLDPWPMASDEAWSAYRTDGSWHATFWIAEWPRTEVGADFLAPLLLGPGRRRAVSLTMAAVPPAQAVREVESARTADLADEELRRKAGFLSTVRRRREADGVLRREAELADGHAEYRFSGYITVSAANRRELEHACAAVEHSAHQAHLYLRRMYGSQEEAFSWTLPLARGLR
jgi:hypothetical protein